MAQTAGVALIDIGQLDGAAGHLLHLFCERSDLGSVALVRSRDLQHQQVAQGVDRDLDLRAFAPFGSIVASPRSRIRVDCNVRLSRPTAVGWPFLPAHSRRINCTSATSASKQPTASQRSTLTASLRAEVQPTTGAKDL
jgi:hypothetical protein